jgi:hypothetical protein
MRGSKPVIKCRLEAAIDRLDEAAPMSIDVDDYGFRNGCQKIVRYAVDRKLQKAFSLTWADTISDILFLAEIGPLGANLPHGIQRHWTIVGAERFIMSRDFRHRPQSSIDRHQLTEVLIALLGSHGQRAHACGNAR